MSITCLLLIRDEGVPLSAFLVLNPDGCFVAVTIKWEKSAKKGDRVALITMNRIELAFAEYAAMKIGCITGPLNFLLKLPELQYQKEVLNKSGFKSAAVKKVSSS
jgi:acyl-coenzyme A synthetase/AMP-(fatty) acid ligase